MSNVFNKFNKAPVADNNMQTFNNNGNKNTDYYTSEFEINDAPIGARNLLTKGFIQDEINQCSGAAISTRGKFMSKNDRIKSPNGRPLYLFIQGPTKQSIELAIQKIDEIIRADIGNPIRPGFGMMQNNTGRPGTFSIQQAIGKPPPSIIGMPANVTTQVEKLYIGLDNLPASFDLRGKIIGQGGSNLNYIRSETGAAVTLRGRGSQFVEPSMGREAPDPLHLHIEHPRAEGLLAARQLAVNLVETLLQELQPDMSAMNTTAPQQVLNLPPRILVAPPLSVPPPQQFNINQNPNMAQHQNQQSQPIEQSMMMGNNQGNTQMQSNQHSIQHQQVILQQPPPIIRPPVVSIPPPGIHIPQHPGPLVPPPQLVQLSGPPPTASGSGNVLVVGPPPNQPLYLPPELVSSSSIGTFSLVQGGVLYHQAPPIQTQAQIGDGLHIITAPSHQGSDGVNITMSPHVHPPPQMIITQVRLEPDAHIVNGQGDHISSHPFQQSNVNQRQKTQFHVIGHVHNQDHQGNLQQQQHFLQQNREVHNLETLTHFSVAGSQNSVANSAGITVPYHLNVSGNGSNVTTVTVSQNDQNQMYRQHMNIVDQNQGPRLQQQTQDMMKRPPRHVIQTGMMPQRQGDDRQIAIQMGEYQNSSERIMQGQGIPQMPPSQIMTDRMPPQIGQQSAPQMMVNRQQETGQIIMNQQCGNVNGNEQLNQMPPHQFTVAQINQQQIPDQHQFNQVQFNRSPYEQMPPRRDQRRQDIQPTSRQSPGNRNRRPGGTDGGADDASDSRLDPYPWSKNEPEKKYPNSEGGWMKRDGERDFEYDNHKPEEFPRCGNVNADNRSRFNRPPGSDGNKLTSEDGRPLQYGRSDQEDDQYDGNKGAPGTNAGHQRNFQQYDPTDGKTFETTQGNWNRSDKPDAQQNNDKSPDSGRKRRFDQEIPWKNRNESSQKSSSSPENSKPPHKKRFDQETYSSPVAGSQSSARSPPGKPFNQNDPPNAEKAATSKWSDPPGEGNTQSDPCEKPKDDEECKSPQKESPGKGATGPANQKQGDLPAEKQNDKFPKTSTAPPSVNQQSGRQPTAWIEQRNDFKGNVQYTNPNQFNQFSQGQNFNSENSNPNERQQYNPNNNFQPNYNISTAQMFQGNIPYLLPPPPPPPPTHSQGNFIHNFNLPQGPVNPSNPPPNIVSMSQSAGQNMSSIPQNVISNINQAPPNMVSDVTAHMQTMPPNMAAQNMNQNAVPFEMAQSIMGNMVQHMPPSIQNAPPGMSQNISNAGQNLQGNNMQGINQMMPGNVQHNMGQIPQNISPYMNQNAPNNMNMPQNIAHHVGQSSNMTPLNQSHVAQVGQPVTNQNMMHASMMGTNAPGMNVNMGNNMNHNMQNPMGQMNMNMAPSMVPPPPNMMSGQQNVPNMVPPPILPPNMTNRPHMGQMANMGNVGHHGAPQNISAVPPPPPPPAVHNMTNQPPYPYWMN